MNANNFALIEGRCAADAVVSKTSNGKPFARFTLLWDKPHKKDEEPPKPNSFSIELFDHEGTYEYLKKGKAVRVVGRIRTSSFKKEDGTTARAQALVAENIQFLPDGAMKGKSIVFIAGNLTSDMEQSVLANEKQTAVGNFTVAVNRTWSKEKEADYIPVKDYGARVERRGRYLEKGKAVSICGRIETDTYKKSDGTTGYSWRVIPFRDDEGESLYGKKKPAMTESSPQEEVPAEPQADVPPEQKASDEITADLGFTELPKEFDNGYFDF